jgi:hypothetical protein
MFSLFVNSENIDVAALRAFDFYLYNLPDEEFSSTFFTVERGQSSPPRYQTPQKCLVVLGCREYPRVSGGVGASFQLFFSECQPVIEPPAGITHMKAVLRAMLLVRSALLKTFSAFLTKFVSETRSHPALLS